MRKYLLFFAAALSAFGQQYAVNAANTTPIARVSFLRSQWNGRNLLGDTSLIGYWKFTQYGASSFLDYSGNGLLALSSGFQSQPAWAGKLGPRAEYFNKSNPNSVYITTSPTITIPMTVMAWVQPGAPSNNYSRIIENLFSSSFYLGTDSTLTHYSFVINGTFATGGTVTSGAWQMVAGTYDGTTMTLYVNGSSVATSTAATNPGTKTIATSIGYCSSAGLSGCVAPQGAWDGAMASIRLYGRALSGAEISAIYAAENH